ncbi:hypothetical protein ACFL4N_03955 [Thermodesulfobacteriota bacterium]
MRSNKNSKNTNRLYIDVLAVLIALIAVVISLKSCSQSQQQIDLLRKDIQVSTTPLLDLEAEALGDLNFDFYIINRGKGAAKNVSWHFLPVGSLQQKTRSWISFIAPGDKIQIGRSHIDSYYLTDLRVKIQYSDIFNEIWISEFGSKYDFLQLVKHGKYKELKKKKVE